MDEAQMLSNRSMLLKLAYEDFQNDGISKKVYRDLCFVFHPDFGNTWNYVPPERQSYTSKMLKLDSNFWKHYKISPDFVLPPIVVYMLYKDYLVQELSPCEK